MSDIEFLQGYPNICSNCKFLEHNSDDWFEDKDCCYWGDDWYTCSCPENSDNEYDLPFGDLSCKFRIIRFNFD